MGRWIAITVLALMTLAAACKKQQQGPDLSNPKAAAITFTRAIETGDAATAQIAAYAAGIEKDLVDAMAVSIPALKHLDATAHAKFGEEAKALVDNPDMLNSIPAIRDAEVTADENRAKLTNKEGLVISQLKHVDGVWKVDVGASIIGRDVTQRVPALLALAKAAKEVSAEIEAGKIDTAANAKRQLQMRILIELRGKSATMPATTTPAFQLEPAEQ